MRRALAGGLVVAGLALQPVVARAQSADASVRADALFNAAKQLRDAGQYADACPRFAESQALAPGVGVTLYLADCYEHIGKTGSAWREFREAEKLARERNDPRAEVAHGRAQQLEPKLSGLTIVVPSAASQEAPEVLLDGTPIPPSEWNAAMAVDPGDHVVTVHVRGQAPPTFSAHVDAGKRGAVVEIAQPDRPAVVAPPVVPPPAPAAPATPAVAATASAADTSASAPASPAATAPPATPADSTASAAQSAETTNSAATAEATSNAWRTPVGLALLGAGVIGIGVGTAFLVRYESTINPPPSCQPPPPDTQSQIASGIAFGAGGVALAASLIVLFTGGHPNPEKTSIVAPMALPGGGGAMFRSSF